MNARNTIRHRYDIAEYRLIAATAMLRAAQEAIALDEPDGVSNLANARQAKEAAERALESWKVEAEEAGIIVNAHPALSIL